MSKWTEENHRAAVLAYLKVGTYEEASVLCGVPWQTIAYWKNSCDWWGEYEREAAKDLESKFRSKTQRAIDMAFERLLERIEKGDQMADGKVMPVKARDMGVILGILLDKSKMDLTLPTGVGTERQSAAERMERYVKLAEEAEARRAKSN